MLQASRKALQQGENSHLVLVNFQAQGKVANLINLRELRPLLEGAHCHTSNLDRHFPSTSTPGHLFHLIFCGHIFLRAALAGTKYF